MLSTNSTLLWTCFIKTVGSREGIRHFWYRRERNFCADPVFSTKFLGYFHVKRDSETWANQSKINISKLEMCCYINKEEKISQNMFLGGIRAIAVFSYEFGNIYAMAFAIRSCWTLCQEHILSYSCKIWTLPPWKWGKSISVFNFSVWVFSILIFQWKVGRGIQRGNWRC